MQFELTFVCLVLKTKSEAVLWERLSEVVCCPDVCIVSVLGRDCLPTQKSEALSNHCHAVQPSTKPFSKLKNVFRKIENGSVLSMAKLSISLHVDFKKFG